MKGPSRPPSSPTSFLGRDLPSPRLGDKPFLLALLFLAGNLLLSYGRLTLEAKIWTFFLLILLPFLAALLEKARTPPPPLDDPAFRHRLSPLWFLLAAALCLFFRFHHLTTLSTWPRLDEGLTGFLSLELSREWRWDLFHGYSQVPPFYQWLEALFFNLFPPSLLSLWALPAVLSTLVCLAAYPAARAFFPPAFSLVCCAFLAGGFFPSYTGRFSQPPVLMLLLEILCLGALGLFLRKAGPRMERWPPLLLGLLVGAGFYTYAAWAPFAALVAGCVAFTCWRRHLPSQGLAFALTAALVLLPLLLGMAQEQYGTYVQRLWIGSGLEPQRQLLVLGSYLSGLLWGTQEGDYGPLRGGWLNPLAGSLFLLGLLGLLRGPGRAFRIFVGIGLLGTLLPGLLTRTVEFFRILGVLPFLLLLCALGLFRLCSGLPRPLRGPALLAGLGLSALLDGFHLFRWYPEKWAAPGPGWGVNIKSVENHDAYGKLLRLSKEKGPGAVLEELQPDPFDRTLTLAVHPFDTARNPKFSWEDTQWVAVLTNLHYGPFLKERFPGASLIRLTAAQRSQYSGNILVVIPRETRTERDLRAWYGFNRSLQASTSSLMRRRQGEWRTKILEDVERTADRAGEDRFLASCYWEKMHVQRNLEAAYGDRRLEEIYPDSLKAIEKAVERGYPAAHLWNEYGTFLALGGRLTEAKTAFLKAVQSPLDETPAARNLERLRK